MPASVISAASAKAGASPAVISGAVVFTDIVSFTEFTAVEGDAAAHDLLSAQETILNQLLPVEARLIKELGDGLMLWFPTAQSALDTCLAMLNRFEQHSIATLQPLWVRIGIHWGRQTRRNDDLIGHDVNLAARIADQAGPTELLLSEDTLRQLDRSAADGPGFDELGPVAMPRQPQL